MLESSQRSEWKCWNSLICIVGILGVEFMMPVSAYYCQICKVFLGDVSFAVDHFKCESHYISYKVTYTGSIEHVLTIQSFYARSCCIRLFFLRIRIYRIRSTLSSLLDSFWNNQPFVVHICILNLQKLAIVKEVFKGFDSDTRNMVTSLLVTTLPTRYVILSKP